MIYFLSKWQFFAISLGLFLGFVQISSAQQTTIFTTDCSTVINSWTYTNTTTVNAIQQSNYWLLEQNDVIVSADIDVSNYTNLTIEYKVATFGSGTNNSGTFEYSTNGGATWSSPSSTQTPTSSTFIAAFSPTQLALGTFNTTQFQFRFKHSGAIGKGLRIDDISLKGMSPACTTPSAVTSATAAANSVTAIAGSFMASSATGYIVVQSTTGTLSASPIDGTTYAVNATLGGGTVIASGTGTTFSKSSLTACTQYWYHIFAYNSTTCSGGPKYSAQTLTTAATTCSLSEITDYTNGPATISSLVNGSITTPIGGVEVWQLQIRDGGSTVDADLLPTILTGVTLTQNTSSTADIGAIQDAVLVDIASNTILGHATISTNLQFTGLNIDCPDDGIKTIGLRITLKSPLPAGTTDGEKFVFNATFSNMTTAAAGLSSQMKTSGSASSNTAKNVIAVVATQLSFLSQPSDIPTNEAMQPSVQVGITDANGNLDLNGNLSISLTSSGTPATQQTVSTINSTATFSNIVHTAVGTGLILTASSGALSATSAPFNIQVSTNLSIGDLAIIAYDTYITTGGDDKIVIANLVDLAAGTSFTVANAVYEIGAAANERTNRWYSGNGGASGASGGGQNVAYIRFRTTAPIAKGSTICIKLLQLAGLPNPASDITVNGMSNANWKVSGPGFVNVNSSGNGDAIWLMQGNFTAASSLDPNNYNYSTFTGNLMGAVQFNSYSCVPGGFYSFDEAVPALDCNTPTITNRVSRIHPDLECVGLAFTPSSAFYLQYSNAAAHTGTQHNLLTNIADFANWTSGAYSSTAADPGDDIASICSSPVSFTVTQPLVHGRWLGQSGGTFTDRDWFFCGNWDNYKVPDSTTNVIIPAVATDGLNANAPTEIDIVQSLYADAYNNIAFAKNLTINSTTAAVRAKLGGIAPSKLEVHGNLTLANGAVLDLSTSATNGGLLSLWGDFTNNNTSDNVSEQGSTVNFMGNATQNITNASGAELLDKVVLQKTVFTLLSLNSDLKANLLDFSTGGIVKTNANKLHLLTTNPANILNYGGSGETDKYIQGKMRQNVAASTTYTFPVGNIAHDCQQAQANFANLANGTYLEIDYTDMGSGSITEPSSFCDLDGEGIANDRVTYNQISGTWNIASDAPNGSLNCTVILLPAGANPYSSVPTDNMRHAGSNVLSCGMNGFGGSGNNMQTVTHFSPFQMVSGAVTLPVKFLEFTAKAHEKSIVLAWRTATELNNHCFEIERSFDNITWQKIGQVKGSGTTNTPMSYTFTDNAAEVGVNYYRLRQIDFDGENTLSYAISAILSSGNNVISLLKNPTDSDLIISILTKNPQISTLEILEIDGKLLVSKMVTLESGANTLSINVESLAAGMYILRLQDGENATVKRFIKK